MSINRVMLSGFIGREPEYRQTASGLPILSFSLAVNERRKNNQTGNYDDYTNWVDVTAMGNRCNFLSQNLHKGMKVSLEGRLRYSKWERDGQTRSKLEVIADEIEFMSQRQQGQPQSQGQYVQAEVYDEPQQGAFDDGIPF
ncbi:MAG: single-stranded DNA-binding protein [Atopobiaceae bacterium]|nr:single-stranded DNA-binding protein [Atopobiaceae bacterium]MBR4614303.1 single-stranded DNA-binding protein [Kiritimatiellia bacterium]